MPYQLSPKERRLRYFGRWFITPVFAIGSGVITTVAASGLVFLSSLALPWLIPILIAIFLAETLASIWLFKDAVPETLVNIFLHNIFSGLSTPKKILLIIGLISAIGGGMAVAALIYVSGMSAFTAILALISISAPPAILMIAAGFLAIVAFFAVSSLFIKWIALAIKNDIHKQIAQFFREIFTRDSKKLLAQQILEGIFKLLFVFTIIAITIVGTIATLGTMHKGLFSFLALIPNANLLACKISSGIIVYALMGASRLPWALRGVCTVFAKIGEFVGYAIFRAGLFIAMTLDLLSETETRLLAEQTESLEKQSAKTNLSDKVLFVFVCVVKVLATLVHAFSFGALAQSGGGAVISDGITQLDPSLPLDEVTNIGETSAMLTGGIMAGGIAAFTFFIPPPPLPTPSAELDEKRVDTEPNLQFLS